MFRIVLSVLTLLSIALVACGFAADVHRAGDSLALLRPVAGAFCAIMCIFVRSWWIKGASSLAAFVSAVTILPLLVTQPAGGGLRLYSKNLSYANQAYGTVAEDILASDVDVVMLQEISDTNRLIMPLLSDVFPHQHFCGFSGRIGIAVLSRTPIVSSGKCSAVRGLAAAQVEYQGDEVWIASLHIHWPWPANTESAEVAALEILNAISGPIVLAGDFNMFPWTQRVREVANAASGRLAGPMAGTYRFLGLDLPIDHVIAPGGGQVVLRPGLGSDHRGLVADVRLDEY